jgi:hypothetical protein
VHAYRLFGLTITSEKKIPHLIEDEGGRTADVSISFRGIDTGQVAGESGLFPVDGGSILLLPGVGSYLIRGGSHIFVDPEPAASERNVNLYLLGSALGALLHQRGVLPLHANVIQVNDSAVAFLGHSGAGKSTLAAWFHDHGHAVLGDDVCVVDVQPQHAMVSAGMPRLRLWREALERSGRQAGDHQMSFDDYEKYDVPTIIAPPPGPLRLSAVYLLSTAEDTTLSIARLHGTEALESLVANTYRGSFLAAGEQKQRHLMQCMRLLGQVPVYRAERAWGIDTFEAVAEGLRKHAIATVAGQQSSRTAP